MYFKYYVVVKKRVIGLEPMTLSLGNRHKASECFEL